jgi:hypothetical protein
MNMGDVEADARIVAEMKRRAVLARVIVEKLRGVSEAARSLAEQMTVNHEARTYWIRIADRSDATAEDVMAALGALGWSSAG